MYALTKAIEIIGKASSQWPRLRRQRDARHARQHAHEVLYTVEQGSVGRALVYRVKNRVTGRIVASWPTYAQASEHARRMDSYFISAEVNRESIARFQEGVTR